MDDRCAHKNRARSRRPLQPAESCAPTWFETCVKPRRGHCRHPRLPACALMSHPLTSTQLRLLARADLGALSASTFRTQSELRWPEHLGWSLGTLKVGLPSPRRVAHVWRASWPTAAWRHDRPRARCLLDMGAARLAVNENKYGITAEHGSTPFAVSSPAAWASPLAQGNLKEFAVLVRAGLLRDVGEGRYVASDAGRRYGESVFLDRPSQ